MEEMEVNYSEVFLIKVFRLMNPKEKEKLLGDSLVWFYSALNQEGKDKMLEYAEMLMARETKQEAQS